MKVLFVCLGNICRSPLAEAYFRKLTSETSSHAQFEVDSAGTGSWHVGESPHRGVRSLGESMGISFQGMQARQVTDDDFQEFDWLIAMDRSNYEDLIDRSRGNAHKVRMLLEFAQGHGESVHDPYYDGDFDRTYRQVVAGCNGFLEFINNKSSQ